MNSIDELFDKRINPLLGKVRIESIIIEELIMNKDCIFSIWVKNDNLSRILRKLNAYNLDAFEKIEFKQSQDAENITKMSFQKAKLLNYSAPRGLTILVSTGYFIVKQLKAGLYIDFNLTRNVR